jgi:hypothetical protein
MIPTLSLVCLPEDHNGRQKTICNIWTEDKPTLTGPTPYQEAVPPCSGHLTASLQV